MFETKCKKSINFWKIFILNIFFPKLNIYKKIEHDMLFIFLMEQRYNNFCTILTSPYYVKLTNYIHFFGISGYFKGRLGVNKKIVIFCRH